MFCQLMPLSSDTAITICDPPAPLAGPAPTALDMAKYTRPFPSMLIAGSWKLGFDVVCPIGRMLHVNPLVSETTAAPLLPQPLFGTKTVPTFPLATVAAVFGVTLACP